MIARFDSFEIDTAQFTLRRDGRVLRLGKQPLDLLIFLIQHRHELVTREAIASALWDSSTYVDSDHGINSVIGKIRKALRDDSATPKYIETVVRRGYRFIAEVAIEADLPVRVEVAPPPVVPVPEPAPQPLVSARRPRSRFLQPLGIGVAIVLAVAAIALLNGSLARQDPPPELSWKPLTRTVHSITRLASDGKSVFWTESDESGCKPWRIPIEGGGDATPVQMPFPNAFILDATADGRVALNVRNSCKDYVIQGAIWELTPASGLTRRLGDLTGQDAVFSPDGRLIALAHWDELWLSNRDGSEPRRIASLAGPILAVRWSPDSKRLRLTTRIEYRYPLWEVDIENGKTKAVIAEWNDGADVSGGAWTADGSFVFGAKRRKSTDLWRLAPSTWPPNGVRPQQITRGPLDFSEPVAIPGRSELAVLGTQRLGELQRFDARLQRFIPFLKGISAEMADFSRDGKWVVYVTYPERELWRSRIDGSDALQLTHYPLRAALPRISPDNSQVAFTGDYSGRDLRIWIVPFGGGEPRTPSRLEKETAEVAPTWSNDGARLLYRLDRGAQRNALAILDISSGKSEQVPGSEQKFNQRWSPDGRWIAATPNDEKGLNIFDVASRKWTTLSRMQADYPSWSRNSDSIYFGTHLPSGEEAVYRVSLASRKPELVTSLLGTSRAFDDMYSYWIGLSPDDSPLILRSAELQRIYLLSLRAPH